MTEEKFKKIIEAKQVVFDDFKIPWDKSIEQKLKREMELRPNADPEVVLDRLTHDMIRRKLGAI